ncbi:MAG: hypothetical protein WD066_09050 [Planctomycetaceae bacterium]
MPNLPGLLNARGVRDWLRESAEGEDRLRNFDRLLRSDESIVTDSLEYKKALERTHRERRTRMRELFRERVLSQLDPPLPVTVRDLTDAAECHLIRSECDFEVGYSAFLDAAMGTAAAWHRSRPFAVAEGYFLWELDPSDDQVCVWRRGDDFAVHFTGTVPLEAEDAAVRGQIISRRQVMATVEAKCSMTAFRRFQNDVRDVLRTGLRTVHHLKRVLSVDPEEARLPPIVRLCVSVSPGIEIHLDDHPARVRMREARMPADCWIVPEMLDAVFARTSKKDSIDRRIRNAVLLLIEADRQRNDAIGLSLAIGAVEALVCRNSDALSQMLAENVAVLLEPEGHERPRAVAFCKQLYDARSRALHGSHLEQERSVRRRARILAGAVLKAILERRDHMRRIGIDAERPDDLLRELQDAKFSPGEVPGVSDSAVRNLWRGADLD